MAEPGRITYRTGAGIERLVAPVGGGWISGRRLWAHCEGVTGLGLPPRAFVEDTFPGVPGTRVTGVVHGARDVTVLLYLESAPGVLLRDALSDLALAFHGGGGVLILDLPTGRRELPCEYAGGLEFEETGENLAGDSHDAVVSFHAPDPYFTGPPSQPAVFRLDAVPAFFPLPPVRLSRARVGAAHTAVNAGSADAYPTWTVTGPGGPLTLTNERSGRSLRWGGSLAAGQVMTIDTTPGVGTVRLADGTSVYRFLGRAAGLDDLWALLPGANPLTIDLQGAGPGASVTLAPIVPRYVAA